MLIIGIFTICLAMPLCSITLSTYHYIRLVCIVLIICVILCGLWSLQIISYDWSIYHSLFHVSSITSLIDILLFSAGTFILIAVGTTARLNPIKIKKEFSLIVIFGILGATLLISSYDLISMYISIELQSFALYLMAIIYTNQMGSTSSSLKYFLLGALSSSFILLGISFIYKEFGTMNLLSIGQLNQLLQQMDISSISTEHSSAIIGLLIILCGIMFKVSAVPFHSWAPDVYQGVPNHIAIGLSTLPKISLFILLSTILWPAPMGLGSIQASSILLFVAIASLVVGTIGGLRQIKIRRLLAFSTISHVGFILLSISQPSYSIENMTSLMFYILQYSLSNILIFMCLVMFDISSHGKKSTDYLVDLQGKGIQYVLLSSTFILCLFSIAGIPPLTGFYAKLFVLKNSIMNDITFVYILAILCSVISASYYLKLIKIIMFDPSSVTTSAVSWTKTAELSSGKSTTIGAINNSVITYIISIIIAFITLFVLDPNLILNSVELCALSTGYIT